jgi:hypothetical protein
MLISTGGIVLRTPLSTVSEHTGRATAGVRVMSLRPGDHLAAISLLQPTNGQSEGDEPLEEDEAGAGGLIPVIADEDVEDTDQDDADAPESEFDDEALEDDEDSVEDDEGA